MAKINVNGKNQCQFQNSIAMAMAKFNSNGKNQWQWQKSMAISKMNS
jgi:hypothetical protein